ncbi:MAG: transporter substrate-binding protein [Cohnella sp.]|nr:transporter substrate-binding protein [Cohnella sp.]
MKSAKNRISLVLIFALLFILAACSGGSKNKESTNSAGSSSDAGAPPSSASASASQPASSGNKEPVTITMLTHFTGNDGKVAAPYIEQWNKENPDIQVKMETVEFTDLLPTIMAKQTSGQTTDIIHIYSLWAGQLAKSNVIAEAPDDIAQDVKSNYPEVAARGASVNGKVFGYPTEVEAFALYYNKKLLKDAGFDQPPKTWDELLSMGKAINKKDGSGKMLTQGFGFVRDWPAIMYHPFLAFMKTAGGTFLSADQTKANLDSDAAKKTMEFYSKVYGKNGISDIGFTMSKAFTTGNAGMVVNAGYWAGSLKATMKPEDFANVAAAPIPSPDGSTKGSITYTWAWSVNKQSKHQEAAWKFLKWYNSQPVKNGMTPEGNFLLDSFNLVSTRNSDVQSQPIQDKLKNDPILQVLNDTLQYADPEPNPVAGAEIQDMTAKQLDSVWTNQTTPDKALEAVQRDVQAKLGQ